MKVKALFLCLAAAAAIQVNTPTWATDESINLTPEVIEEIQNNEEVQEVLALFQKFNNEKTKQFLEDIDSSLKNYLTCLDEKKINELANQTVAQVKNFVQYLLKKEGSDKMEVFKFYRMTVSVRLFASPFHAAEELNKTSGYQEAKIKKIIETRIVQLAGRIDKIEEELFPGLEEEMMKDIEA